ncbi:Trihelix transcription factor ASIL2 [Linum perenne]
MDDTEDDARYPPDLYQQGYNHPPNQDKLPVCNSSYRRGVVEQYGNEDDDEEEEPSMDEHLGDDDGGDNTQNISKGLVVSKDLDNDDEDEDEDDGYYDEEDDDEDADENTRVGNADLGRHPRKRKLKSLASSYEFAPRVPPPSQVALVPIVKPLLGGRNPLTDWTEQETFALLDAWGEKFLQRGRKSLRSDEWLEVAEKVSEVSKVERTDTQCKNRLDTVKKKYKKEKDRMVVGSGSRGSSTNSWVYFKKMDMLMSTSAQQQQRRGLSCGLDSGEYVFMNPKVYINRANGFDEMRDSPGKSESGDDDNSDGLPPKKRWCRSRGGQNEEGSSFSLLADSIERFSEIYEKIETSKRQQMVELEKMRMEFQRDLEMQKRQMMERAQFEMEKIRQGGHDVEQDTSGEDASG